MRTKSQQPYFSFGSILLVALILMTSQTLYSQSIPPAINQDVSSFYNVAGFHNPLLRSGQYMVSLTPHFFHYENNSNSTSQSYSQSTSESSSKSSSKSSYYDFSFASFYGISNDITLNLTLSYFPRQNVSTGQSSSLSSSLSSSSPYSYNSLYNYSSDQDNINSAVVISYRPERYIELAFQARYSSSKDNGRSNGVSFDNYISPVSSSSSSNSDTGNSPSYDLSFSIVFMGN